MIDKYRDLIIEKISDIYLMSTLELSMFIIILSRYCCLKFGVQLDMAVTSIRCIVETVGSKVNDGMLAENICKIIVLGNALCYSYVEYNVTKELAAYEYNKKSLYELATSVIK